MENSRKLGKARKGRRDRLSRLPGPIIYHILSFLDTKLAVQTSVLSRAWRCAWKHVPVLNLNQTSFEQYSSFIIFVDSVLSLRYPLRLREVSFIDSGTSVVVSFMNNGIMDEQGEREEHRLYARVIGYALLHDAQHIAINLDSGEEPECSPDFFHLFGSVTKSNIETLQLRAVSFRNSQYSGFGSVTTLDLYYCWVTDLDVFSDSNFPCLENLVMEECRCYKYTRTETISGLNLVSLKLFPVPSQRLEIRAPKLNFLSLAFRLEVKLLKSSLPSLEHAEIRLGIFFRFDPDDIEKLQFLSLFQDLHNVESLTLHHLTIEALSQISEILEEQPSPFTRLKCLKLQSNNVPYNVVDYFLKGSPNTEPHIEFLGKVVNRRFPYEYDF